MFDVTAQVNELAVQWKHSRDVSKEQRKEEQRNNSHEFWTLKNKVEASLVSLYPSTFAESN